MDYSEPNLLDCTPSALLVNFKCLNFIQAPKKMGCFGLNIEKFIDYAIGSCLDENSTSQPKDLGRK